MSRKQKLQELIELIEHSGVTEIEISSFWGIKKVKISKNQTASEPVQKMIPVIHPESSQAPGSEEHPAPSGNIHEIKAPLVGTFYASSKPGESPFVKTGDIISTGQVVCIIEAMKIFNEIESDISGKITRILVENEQPVEFDQPLFIVEPL